jgi:hypothetical protein
MSHWALAHKLRRKTDREPIKYPIHLAVTFLYLLDDVAPSEASLELLKPCLSSALRQDIGKSFELAAKDEPDV